MQQVTGRLNAVKQRIQQAELAAGRTAGSVQLLAVSKTKPVTDISTLAEAGQVAFAESYLQEALAKIQALQSRQLEWHFIGAIQSNKTRDIAQHFDWVHTVARDKIARRLSDQRPDDLPPLNICLQVNIDADPRKAGIAPEQAMALAMTVAGMPRLRLRGLMCIPAPARDPASQRLPFHALARLQDELVERGLALDTLSMGMSDDLEAAILEGATIVRVGTALFGPRKQDCGRRTQD
jgi:pyridoxal phosphate enzyme (YggS family)